MPMIKYKKLFPSKTHDLISIFDYFTFLSEKMPRYFNTAMLGLVITTTFQVYHVQSAVSQLGHCLRPSGKRIRVFAQIVKPNKYFSGKRKIKVNNVGVPSKGEKRDIKPKNLPGCAPGTLIVRDSSGCDKAVDYETKADFLYWDIRLEDIGTVSSFTFESANKVTAQHPNCSVYPVTITIAARTANPTGAPTNSPTPYPLGSPTPDPTPPPTPRPTPRPTWAPTTEPSPVPSMIPSPSPSALPSISGEGYTVTIVQGKIPIGNVLCSEVPTDLDEKETFKEVIATALDNHLLPDGPPSTFETTVTSFCDNVDDSDDSPVTVEFNIMITTPCPGSLCQDFQSDVDFILYSVRNRLDIKGVEADIQAAAAVQLGLSALMDVTIDEKPVMTIASVTVTEASPSPSGAPSHSASPTARPSQHCEDSNEMFLNPNTGEMKGCAWVARIADKRKKRCKIPDAKKYCPDTCGVAIASGRRCSAAPSASPSLLDPKDCRDSDTLFLNVNTGLLRGCEWVARKKTDKRCRDVPGVKSHCPKTCNSCVPFQCRNSVADFQLQNPAGMVRSCSYFWKDAKPDRTERLCKLEYFYTTCRELCGYCARD